MNTPFSFNSFAQVKVGDQNSYLKPYSINNNVTIKSTEIKEGTSSNGNSWKSLVITFGNDEGIYHDSTFFLDINDPKVVERNEVDASNGGKRQMPSRWEQTYYKLAAIGHAFAPDLIEKFNKIIGKCKTFEEFIKTYKSMLDKVANKTTNNMKLVGRNNNGTIYAVLPNCVGIAQANTEAKAASNGVNLNEWYTWMTSPFGDKLAFTSYEETQKEKLANAKPTNMSKVETGVNVPKETTEEKSEELDELDFDLL